MVTDKLLWQPVMKKDPTETAEAKPCVTSKSHDTTKRGRGRPKTLPNTIERRKILLNALRNGIEIERTPKEQDLLKKFTFKLLKFYYMFC